MNEQYAPILTAFPLLHGFTTAGAQMLLDAGQVKEHAPGDTLFQEGDPATFTCLALTGKLQVFTNRKGRELVLRETGPGEVLGELAVLCGTPRTASVRAMNQAAVLHWSADAFRRLLLRHSLLSERILGQSLRVLIEKERSLLDALGQQIETSQGRSSMPDVNPPGGRGDRKLRT